MRAPAEGALWLRPENLLLVVSVMPQVVVRVQLCRLSRCFAAALWPARSKTADKEPISNPIGAWIVTITRYLALIGLYAGVILVVRDVS